MTIPTPTIHLPMGVAQYQPDNLGAEQVTDWDMGAGDVTAWTAVNGAVLTKQSNGEGGQVLRVARGVSPNPQATQVVTTTGQWSMVKIRVRSDATITGKIFLGGTQFFEFTTSSSFEVFEFNVLANATTLIIQADGISSVDYIEVDILSMKSFGRRTLDISGNDHHAAIGDGMTDSSFADLISDKGFNFPSTTQFLEIPAGALQATSTLTISCMVRKAKVGSSISDFIAAYDGTNTYFILTSIGTVSKARFYVGGLSGLNAANADLIAGEDDFIHFIGEYTGSATQIYKNLVPGTVATTPIAPNFQNQTIKFARRTTNTNWQGDIFNFRLWFSVLSAAEKAELYHEDRRSIGGLAIV